MIAIAGAKGGCGKTTTALGLAEIFSQSGVPTLVVDADRQLPNLHLVAGVNREPTIGSLSVGSTLSEHTHQHPDFENVRILTAPKPEENIDFKSALSKLDIDSIQVIVDCPAGTGPDAIDPLVVADRTIVVTTDTKQSYEAAQKTIDTAKRADSTVEAVVINKCDNPEENPPIDTASPLIQTVPERPTDAPRTDPDVRRSHSMIVTELLNERVQTGIPSLDEAIDGGMHPGSVVGITATPDSRSELLLHALTTTDHHTVYITTERSPQIILDRLNSSAVAASAPIPVIKHITELVDTNAVNPLEDLEELLESLPRKSNLIIDSMDRLEQFDKQTHISFMNSLHEAVQKSGGIALIHMLDRKEIASNRSITQQFVDVLLSIDAVDTDTTQQWQLSITNSRLDDIPTTSMTVELF